MLATNLQTSCGFLITSRTVCRELHGMGFNVWAAACKSYITNYNAKSWMQWCKARHHCCLEWWIMPLGLSIQWTSLVLVVARRTVKCTSLVEGRLWCGVVFQKLSFSLKTLYPSTYLLSLWPHSQVFILSHHKTSLQKASNQNQNFINPRRKCVSERVLWNKLILCWQRETACYNHTWTAIYAIFWFRVENLRKTKRNSNLCSQFLFSFLCLIKDVWKKNRKKRKH